VDKRNFLKVSGSFVVGASVLPISYSCQGGAKENKNGLSGQPAVLELPDLPYDYNALEPIIDEKTMRLHHDKHHAGYTRKAKKAIEEAGLTDQSMAELLNGLDGSDEFLQNNLGGYINHKLFWTVMGPEKTEAKGDLADAINSAFGSMDQFNESFFNEAKSVFGSGWAWLNVDDNKKLFVSSTSNQDSPLMSKIAEQPGTPILGIDVWEHAYYLKYRNERGKYIQGFMDLINWNEVAQRFAEAVK